MLRNIVAIAAAVCPRLPTTAFGRRNKKKNRVEDYYTYIFKLILVCSK